MAAPSTRSSARGSDAGSWPSRPSSTRRFFLRPSVSTAPGENAGATTPSEKFSAQDSIAARHTPARSRLSGSRPTIIDTARRASVSPPAKASGLGRYWPSPYLPNTRLTLLLSANLRR